MTESFKSLLSLCAMCGRTRVSRIASAAVLTFAVFSAGCGRKSPGEAGGETNSAASALTPEGEERFMDDLKDSDIIFRVNGVAYTKADFLIASSLEDKLRRMQAGDPVIGPNKPAEEAKIASRPHTLSDMVRRELLRQYAASKGLVVSAEEREVYIKALLRNLKRTHSTISQVAGEFTPEEGRLFLKYVEDDSAAQPLRNLCAAPGELNVLEGDVVAASNRWLRSQAAANASNTVERAVLDAALSEISAGVDFAKVAQKYSETPEDGEKWNDFLLQEMQNDEELLAWAANAKAGDVSGILALDDGWAVVKVLARRPEDLPPGSTDEPRELWELARISRKMYETVPGQSHDEIVQIITSYRNGKIQRRIGDEIMAASKIEWPHGEKLFNDETGEGASVPPAAPNSTPSAGERKEK